MIAQLHAFWMQTYCFDRGDKLPHLLQMKHAFHAFRPTSVGCSACFFQCEKGHCYLTVEMTIGTVEAGVAAVKLKVQYLDQWSC